MNEGRGDQDSRENGRKGRVLLRGDPLHFHLVLRCMDEVGPGENSIKTSVKEKDDELFAAWTRC
jgi:hypothetical protein